MLLLLLVFGFGRPHSKSADLPKTGPIDTGYRIAVNSADASSLELLPGVGPSIARNVIETRTAMGPFRDAEQLERVHMIGPVLRQRISPWVRFDRDINP
jgi:competence protein ComEA